ncbi:MAG: ABC transporter ATP-binding protein [Deltaproteobacteria bacterium]|nr:ABC transporter ATP-binding protein [Deltaproteobacteria bacterium]
MPGIKITGLKKTYGNGREALDVLKGIDVEFFEADTVALVGASGAGKSTFLNLLGALDRPCSGKVEYGDTAVFDLSDTALAAFRNSTVGFVFQFHHLLPEFTAMENVMLPALINGQNKAAAKERAKELLGSVGLSKRLTHRPGELSGGEQQRCSIVRALMQRPKVVLADEPTGNLDTRTGDSVFEVLLKLNAAEKTTLIVATHNEALASKMSRKLEMIDGKIHERTLLKA